MFDLRQFQEDRLKWETYNFPETVGNDHNRHHPFLGMVEEVGELGHAMLKYEQGIRDGRITELQLREQLADGVGDLVIYLAAFCDMWDLDLEEAIDMTWQKVCQRDWVRYPGNGMTE